MDWPLMPSDLTLLDFFYAAIWREAFVNKSVTIQEQERGHETYNRGAFMQKCCLQFR